MRVPILRLGRILLTSIPADLTDEQATQLQAEILALIRDERADGAIIDISIVDVVDSYMARLLNETARMIRIMGGEAVLTGMQPFVALTLVEMGRESLEMKTAHDIETGVEMLKAMMAGRSVPGPVTIPRVSA